MSDLQLQMFIWWHNFVSSAGLHRHISGDDDFVSPLNVKSGERVAVSELQAAVLARGIPRPKAFRMRAVAQPAAELDLRERGVFVPVDERTRKVGGALVRGRCGYRI